MTSSRSSAAPTSSIPGMWESQISAEMLAKAGVRFAFTQPFNGDVFWDEERPNEGGRNVVVSEQHGDILRAPWSAKTRVHEMGGLSWLVTLWNGASGLLFCEASDQRLYWQVDGGEPVAITPESSTDVSWRYCDMLIRGDEVWCIREASGHDATTRSLIAISPDGDIRELDSQSHFYAHLTLSPDDNMLAWIAWEHPQMPWDGTELFIADINHSGQLENKKVLAGSKTEAVNSPTWVAPHELCYLSDASGWWNVWSTNTDGESGIVSQDNSEWALPMWFVGWRYLSYVGNNTVIGTRGPLAQREIVALDVTTGTWTSLASELNAFFTFSTTRHNVYAVGGGVSHMPSVVSFTISQHKQDRVIQEIPLPVSSDFFSTPYEATFPSVDGRIVHAIMFPPANPHYATPGLTPVIITAHGGPTGHEDAVANIKYAYFTSRGFTVIAVNYGGSTGYGRAYRNALRGLWGVVDTEDIIAVAQGVINQGIAEPEQVFIRGGSAGGFAVLNALVHSDIFAGGADYYGVADLIPLAQDTHDFESRYLDSLVGPYPESADLYIERSPLTHTHKLNVPVIFFQGLDDPIVPPSQSQAFRDVCIEKGLRHKYFEFEGESHGFGRADTIILCAEEELQFYRELITEPHDLP